jgi:hypothetical protein
MRLSENTSFAGLLAALDSTVASPLLAPIIANDSHLN